LRVWSLDEFPHLLIIRALVGCGSLKVLEKVLEFDFDKWARTLNNADRSLLS